MQRMTDFNWMLFVTIHLSVLFCNEPAPKKYLEKGFSPLHTRTRTILLFDTVKDAYHICVMDNLYNSAIFRKKAFKNKKKILVQGVTQKSMGNT